MEQIILKKGLCFTLEDIKALYEDAGWITYVRDMDRLLEALENSLCIMTAWYLTDLVGLIRVVGDGISIIYIQDILVKKLYKRKGIGTHLLNMVMMEYPKVGQKVLLTDNTGETRGFYEASGFKDCRELKLAAFVKFD